MIIVSDGFFKELSDNKICTITGRLGSGKTLLAMELARYYLDRGYSLVTNTKTVWADNPIRVMERAVENQAKKQKEIEAAGHNYIAPFQVRSVSIVDEGGLYARSPKFALDLASFARKTDQIIVFSGKKLPHSSLCDLQVVMWFDFYKNFGLPFKLWQWSYRLSPKKIYYGKLIQTRWQDLYGIYSTIDPADNADKILDFSVKATRNLFKVYGREYKLSDMGATTNPSPEDAMEELASSLADVVELANSPVSNGKGRGRK